MSFIKSFWPLAHARKALVAIGLVAFSVGASAQSIVVASTATRWFNKEGEILRYVFFHSIALACLVGIFVTMQAYVWPFTLMVVK